MVGPSLSGSERDRRRRQLRAGFVLIVTVSGAMVAFANGASPPVVAAATAGALAVGAALVWYLDRIAPW